MTLRTRSVAASLATACALVATPASAIDVTLVNLLSTAVSAFGEPGYGTVTLSQDGTSVDFLVELRPDLNLVTAGDSGSKSVFSFNAAGVSAGDIVSIMDEAGKTFAVAQPGINLPFGQFTFGIICTNNCQHPVAGDLLAFKVVNATIADFFISSTGGNPNAVFAVDVFKSGTGETGAVAALTVTTPVPEPGTYVLMLAGLAAMGLIARRREGAAGSRANRVR